MVTVGLITIIFLALFHPLGLVQLGKTIKFWSDETMDLNPLGTSVTIPASHGGIIVPNLKPKIFSIPKMKAVVWD